MTPDLRYLAFTAFLTGSLWIPYVICQVMTNGFLAPANYVDPQPRSVPLWGKRADRALMNGVEVLGTFAALVIVAHLAGKANAMTAMGAAISFWARLVYAVIYTAGITWVRSLVFGVSMVGLVIILLQLV